ncbi:class I SAM-dependent methyltransferase [Ornithinicoccus halotolerans]|uniref:class I SAM-dependent methyltransferase n=1 Tax=Ornithinicoccus halotolerans TaxID=1748220 RepID=UPI0012948E97|nr:class I SAM-dependent methyltransferase [Ornithinicoccus halotolerans]
MSTDSDRPETTAASDAADPGPQLSDQAPILLGLAAGYIGHRCVGLGLRSGLIAELADGGPRTARELAGRRGLDPYLVWVWCRGAFAAGLVERAGDEPALAADARYELAPHMATLLLDSDSPAFLGGIFPLLEQPEVFDRFERTLATGERMWWADTSPDWIQAVSRSGRPFYTRLVPGGLAQVPGLAERLGQGGRVVDTACGTGRGLVRLATHYPQCELVGVDGDPHSIEQARAAMAQAGLAERVQLVCSPLEEFTLDQPASVVINNISMHECRDIDQVTRQVRAALDPGGWFVVSDFPFPEDEPTLRTPPGRLMSGVQVFEAQIDDQLLPRAAYDGLLDRHGFTDVDHVQLTPVHAVTWGRRAA